MNKTRTQQSRGKVYEDFGEKIKQLRVSRNLTQDDLSKQIGISRTNIGQYETGVRKVPLSVIVKFSDFFNVSVDYLLDIEVNTNVKTKHISKYEVASEIGFTKEEINSLQSGDKQLLKSFFEKFANYFDVDIENLNTLNLENKNQQTVITNDEILIERYKKWQSAIGYEHFTDEEIDQLIDYAQYLISKRK